MKKLFLITVLSLFSTSAFAASLISTELISNGKVNRLCGFGEDGFSTPDSVCYKGKVEKVCELLIKDERSVIEQYSEGSHGYFLINNCSVRPGGVVEVNYTKDNDYEGKSEVKLEIDKCAADLTCGF